MFQESTLPLLLKSSDNDSLIETVSARTEALVAYG